MLRLRGKQNMNMTFLEVAPVRGPSWRQLWPGDPLANDFHPQQVCEPIIRKREGVQKSMGLVARFARIDSHDSCEWGDSRESEIRMIRGESA